MKQALAIRLSEVSKTKERSCVFRATGFINVSLSSEMNVCFISEMKQTFMMNVCFFTPSLRISCIAKKFSHAGFVILGFYRHQITTSNISEQICVLEFNRVLPHCMINCKFRRSIGCSF